VSLRENDYMIMLLAGVAIVFSIVVLLKLKRNEALLEDIIKRKRREALFCKEIIALCEKHGIEAPQIGDQPEVYWPEIIALIKHLENRS